MFIKSYCRITNHSIVLDGQRQETLGKFLNGHHVSEDLDNVFEQLDADYPAFFGMDEFSTLGFITAELLMRHNGYDTETFKPDIGGNSFPIGYFGCRLPFVTCYGWVE